MLFRNGENLKSGLTDYLTGTKNLTIFCPYIKYNALCNLLDSPGLGCDQIVVRWEPRDLVYGSSDLEIYEICKKHDIALYMNHRIHLKLFTRNYEDVFTGSANISERAISDATSDFNYEVCTYLDNINRLDRLYLESIINQSILVNDDIYNEIQSQLSLGIQYEELDYFEIPNTKTAHTDFLISKLPMTDSPELLWQIHSEEIQACSTEQENCVCHDIVLYKLDGLEHDRDKWFNTLKTEFFSSLFIKEFLKQVDSSVEVRNGRERKGLRFGAVRKWFSENTTSVPSPRPFELTDNVQILYRWIEDLSDGKYSVTVPGQRSQVLVKN